MIFKVFGITMQLNRWLVLSTVIILWLSGSLLERIFFNAPKSVKEPQTNRPVNKNTSPPSAKPKIVREYVPPSAKPIYQSLPEASVKSNIKPLPAVDPLAVQSNIKPLPAVEPLAVQSNIKPLPAVEPLAVQSNIKPLPAVDPLAVQSNFEPFKKEE